MGYDPSNINATEELIKKKNTEVATLKKKLKLPASEDPMAKEIKTETQKSDMMKLIIEHNLKIKQMEEQMEKLVKEKEEAIKNIQTSMDVVSLATFPITRVSTTVTTSVTSIEKGVEQLTESVQNLSIQIAHTQLKQTDSKAKWKC